MLSVESPATLRVALLLYPAANVNVLRFPSFDTLLHIASYYNVVLVNLGIT